MNGSGILRGYPSLDDAEETYEIDTGWEIRNYTIEMMLRQMEIAESKNMAWDLSSPKSSSSLL